MMQGPLNATTINGRDFLYILYGIGAHYAWLRGATSCVSGLHSLLVTLASRAHSATTTIAALSWFLASRTNGRD